MAGKFDPEYAATRVATIDGDIEAHKAAIKDLQSKRKPYADSAPKKTPAE